MSSLRKLESCHQNGAKSHGPVTPEGKERSAMNGLRHGFAASRVVLATEDHDQFDAMRDAFIEKHHPADEVESSLVDEMVVANWRLQRMWAAESSLFDHKIQALSGATSGPSAEPDPAALFGTAFEAFAGGADALKLMMRYETNCRWQYDRALRSLQSLRKAAAGQAHDGPLVGPATTVRFFYCLKKEASEQCPR
jgi:hypothetical protein